MSRIVFVTLGAYVNPYNHQQVFGLAVNVRANVISTTDWGNYVIHHITHQRIRASKDVDGRPVLLAQLHKSAKREEGWIRVMKPHAEPRRLPRI